MANNNTMGPTPGKSQVRIGLSSDSINSFHEMARAVDEAKTKMQSLRQETGLFTKNLEEMKALAVLMKQISLGVNAIGMEQRTNQMVLTNTLRYSPVQAAEGSRGIIYSENQRLLKDQERGNVLREAAKKITLEDLEATKQIYDLKQAEHKLDVARQAQALAMREGNKEDLQMAQLMEVALEGRLTLLKEIKRQTDLMNKGQLQSEAAAITGYQIPQKGPKPPKTADEIAADMQASRLNKVKGILGDGGASMFAVQTGLLMNYSIINGVTSAFKYAIQFSTELDQSFHELQAITNTTNTEMVRMRENLLDVASQSKFAATEVANAAVILGQAGLSVAQIKDSMASVTALATASGSGLKQSADVITSVMGSYNMSASQTTEIANIMTQALNVSKLDMDKLSMGVQYASNTAQQAGISFKEMTAILGTMSNQGIKSGSTLGTGLRQIIIDIEKPTAKFKETLDRLGLGLSDVDIKSHGLTGVLKTLHDAGFSSADAFASFEVRAAAAFNALTDNLDKVKEMESSLSRTDAVEEANARQMESFANQATRLKSNLGILISEALEPMQKLLTGLTATFADLSAGMVGSKEVLGFFGTVFSGAAIGMAVTQVARLLSGLKALVVGFMDLEAGTTAWGAALAAVGGSTALLTAGIGALVAVVATYGYSLLRNTDYLSKAKEAEDKATATSNDYRAALDQKQQMMKQVGDKIEELTNKQNHLSNANGTLQEQVTDVEAIFAKFGRTLDDNAKASVPNLIAALRNLNKELGLAENLGILDNALKSQKSSEELVLSETLRSKREPNRYMLGSSVGASIAYATAGQNPYESMVSGPFSVNEYVQRLGMNRADANKLWSSLSSILNFDGKNHFTDDQMKNADALSMKLKLSLEDKLRNPKLEGGERSSLQHYLDVVGKIRSDLHEITNAQAKVASTQGEITDNEKKRNIAKATNTIRIVNPNQIGDGSGHTHQDAVIREFVAANINAQNADTSNRSNLSASDFLAQFTAYRGLVDAAYGKSELLRANQSPDKLKMFTADTRGVYQQSKQFVEMYKGITNETMKAVLQKPFEEAQKVVTEVERHQQEYKTTALPQMKTKMQTLLSRDQRLVTSIAADAEQEGDPVKIETDRIRAAAAIRQKYVHLRQQAQLGKGAGSDPSKDSGELKESLKALDQQEQFDLQDNDKKYEGLKRQRVDRLKKESAQLQQIINKHDDDAISLDLEKGVKQIQAEYSALMKRLQQPLKNLQRQLEIMQDSRYSMHYSNVEVQNMQERIKALDEASWPQQAELLRAQQEKLIEKRIAADARAATAQKTFDHLYQQATDIATDPSKGKDVDKTLLASNLSAAQSILNRRLGESADIQRNITNLAEKESQIREKMAQQAPDVENWKDTTISGIKKVAETWDEHKNLVDGLVGDFAAAKDATTGYFDTLLTSIDSYKQKYKSFGVFLREETKAWMSDILKSVLHTINQILAQKMLLAMLSAFGVSTTTTAAPGGATGYMGNGQMVLPSSPTAIRGGLITNTGIRHMAGGGLINGPIRGQDSQLILGMPGEIVMNKSAVDAVGADTLMALNAMGNSQVSKSGERIKPIDETQRNRPPAHTNVWVVTPDQKPQMGPNDVIAIVSDDLARGGSIKQLVKSVASGY